MFTSIYLAIFTKGDNLWLFVSFNKCIFFSKCLEYYKKNMILGSKLCKSWHALWRDRNENSKVVSPESVLFFILTLAHRLYQTKSKTAYVCSYTFMYIILYMYSKQEFSPIWNLRCQNQIGILFRPRQILNLGKLLFSLARFWIGLYSVWSK